MGEVLTESLEACSEDEVKEFCDVLYAKLCSGQNGEDPGGVSGGGVAKLLDVPVHLAMKLKGKHLFLCPWAGKVSSLMLALSL